MSEGQRILSRLREDPEHLRELVQLIIDEALERPLSELVEPAWLAAALADGIHQAADSDELEAWIRQRLEETLTRADRLDGTIGDHVPVTMLGPLETAIGREITPSRELIAAVIDHPSLRELIAAILQQNILEFGQKLRAFVPDGGALPGAKLRSRIGGLAKGVASVVGGEVERQFEDRVRQFVDDALGRAMDMAIERFSSPQYADEMARWRIDVLHGLLAHPLENLVAERHKYPPALFAADLTALVRAMAGWRRLTGALEETLERVFGEFGDQTAGAWLDGSGIQEAWRPHLEDLMVQQLAALVQTEAFASWLSKLAAESP